MADLAQDAGISGDEHLLDGAQKLSTYLWNVAWHHAPGTLIGDAEALHDMRVAVRRLRSALQNFEGEKAAPLVAPHLWRELNDWRKELGRFGDVLGAVRDGDVLSKYVDDYAKTRLRAAVEENSGLEKVKRYLSDRRADDFVVLTKKIDKAGRPGRLHEGFAQFALGLPAASGANPSFHTALRIIMPQRKAEVLLHAPSLDDPEDEIGQHELRKALKRLRYTLEFFAPCFEEPVKKRVKQITEMQDSLGEMQDRTVLHAAVGEAFNTAKLGEENLPEDVLTFLQYGDGRRRRLLTQARKQWAQLNTDFFEN